MGEDSLYSIEFCFNGMVRGRHALRLQKHVEQGRDAIGHLQVQLGAVGGAHASTDFLPAHERQRPNADGNMTVSVRSEGRGERMSVGTAGRVMNLSVSSTVQWRTACAGECMSRTCA